MRPTSLSNFPLICSLHSQHLTLGLHDTNIQHIGQRIDNNNTSHSLYDELESHVIFRNGKLTVAMVTSIIIDEIEIPSSC